MSRSFYQPGVRLKKGGIYLFKCNLDGKTVSNVDCRNVSNDNDKCHYFLILSHELYNQRMNSFLCVGISSSENQVHRVKRPIDEFESWSRAIDSGNFNAFKGVADVWFIVDKVCRVSSADLVFKGDQLNSVPILRKPYYEELVEEIRKFMLIGNDDPNV